LQIPLLSGRSFSEGDGPDSQPVAIVNRAFARKFFPAMNPVGMHVDNKLIVGVVGDIVVSSAGQLNEGSEPLTDDETLYLPAAQETSTKSLSILHVWYQPSWIVRTSAAVSGLNAQMQRALASVDPNLPFSGFYAFKDLMARTLAMQRVEVALLTAMAALALLLSAIGIFALVANTVAQKTREIGIRIALGSTIERAMVHIGSSGATASALGLLLGLVLCAGALRAMRSVIYGVGVYDGRTLGLVVLTLCAITLLATTLPVLRIARIDPARTLRQE
jgi:ABC-type antimicrobial peptide transport system permease subunit